MEKLNDIIKRDLIKIEDEKKVIKWNGFINGETGMEIICDSGMKTNGGKKLYRVKCICGNEFLARLDDIKSGKTKSCGCLSTKAKVKSPQYDRAVEILRRCNNPTAINYKNYGGRGIKCLLGETPKEVAANLETIPGYFQGLQIDRIDNDGDYTLYHPEHGYEVWYDEYGNPCKGNLRWVTKDFNNMNKRNSLMLKDYATKYRPYKDLAASIKAHKYSMSEFIIHMKYSKEHERHIAIAIHRSFVKDYIQRLFSPENYTSSDVETLELPILSELLGFDEDNINK